MPSATQEKRQKWQQGTQGPADCPFGDSCRGDGTVNHGYLHTEPETTSQAPW